MAYTTIDNGKDYFNTLTWSGDNSTRSITGVGFSPDWVWIKSRSDSAGQVIYDSVRGNGKQLQTHNADAEQTNPQFGYVSSFNSDGFTLTPGTYSGYESGNVNMSGRTFVGWNWRGSDSNAVSNTDGTNASTISANQTAGFSIVTYTRDSNSVTTVGHGLGKTPKVKIEKDRDSDSTSWSFITNASGSDQYGFLDTTATFNSTTSGFTSTVFRSAMGANQGAILAYVFAEIQGYSKFGIYEGNGSTDGAFVYTGFKPSFIIMKPTNQSTEWTLQDTARDPVNPVNNRLIPNDYAVEYTNTSCLTDFLSNGFKMRTNHPSNNSSGYTYFYMAFAEHPFVSSEGVPVTAR